MWDTSAGPALGPEGFWPKGKGSAALPSGFGSQALPAKVQGRDTLPDTQHSQELPSMLTIFLGLGPGGTTSFWAPKPLLPK